MRQSDRQVDVPFWAAVVLCCAALAGAVSATSLWIDEGFIAWVAGHRTLGSLIETIRGPLPSPADRQYPLYDLWIFGWTHLFGFSEYALRAANLPFAVVYVVALALASRRIFARRFSWIPFAIIPFMWYYVNEARSYFMVAALATVAVAAVAVYTFGPPEASRRAPWFALPALILAWLTNIVGMFAFPGVLIIALFGRRQSLARHWSAWWRALAVWALPFLGTAAYYYSTLAGGGGNAEVANNQGRVSSLSGSLQILYEHLGFAGLGPPRNALRAITPALGWSHYALWIAIGVVAAVIVAYEAFRHKVDLRVVPLAIAWAVSYALAIAASSVLHARFLGRHLAAVVPLLVFAALPLVVTPLAAWALTIGFATSDLRLTLLPDYWKDDYRAAVDDVCTRNERAPGSIVWVADSYTAEYYGLGLTGAQPATVSIRPQCAVGRFATNLSADDAERALQTEQSQGKRVYLAFSKPDVYDIRRGWTRTLAARGAHPVAQYRAFEIYDFAPGGR